MWGTTLFEEIETQHVFCLWPTFSVLVWGTTLFEEIETRTRHQHQEQIRHQCGELLCLKRSKPSITDVSNNCSILCGELLCLKRSKQAAMTATLRRTHFVWGTTLFEEIETCKTVNFNHYGYSECGELLCLKRSKL